MFVFTTGDEVNKLMQLSLNTLEEWALDWITVVFGAMYLVKEK